MITIFKDIYDKENPHYISIESSLKRIMDGNSKDKVIEIRNEADKEKRNYLKKSLPCVCYGGKFSQREDDKLMSPSGYICLDFDGYDSVGDAEKYKSELTKCKFIYSTWISPSGQGVKALVRIPRNSSKYKNIFFSLMEYFDVDEWDASSQNISRVCYESWDENIYINKNSDTYTDEIYDIQAYRRLKKLRKKDVIYDKLKKWLDSYETFVNGNRNNYVFKLTCAMNRFGIDEHECLDLLTSDFLSDDFPSDEIHSIVTNVYDKYSDNFDSARFTDERSFNEEMKEAFVDRKEGEINPIDLVVNPSTMSRLQHDFYEGKMRKADTTGSKLLDKYFPFKHNEMIYVVGATKIGKSSLLFYLMTLAAKFSNWKWLVASTENESYEIRHIITSYLIGRDARKYYGDSFDEIRAAEKFFDNHFILVDAAKMRSFEDHVAPIYYHLKNKGVNIDAILLDPQQAMGSPIRYGRKSDDATHSDLAEEYKKWAISECSIYLVAHTRAEAQRENQAPTTQQARFGTVYANACHQPCSLHRNIHADKNSKEFYSTELRIFAQRTKFSKGGDTSTDGGIKFIYSYDPFGFDIEVDGVLETNPLLPLEKYYPSKVESTLNYEELKDFSPKELKSLDIDPSNGFDGSVPENFKDEVPVDEEDENSKYPF